MGCNDSRKLYPEEEQTLIRAEALLNFHLKPVQSLYETFTALSRGGVLNSNAFKDAITALNLPVASANYPGLLDRFYQNLKDSSQNVNLQTMQLLAILLGAGRPADRAKVLFQVYDQDYSLILSKTIVEKMIKDLIAISVDVLGQLGSIGESEHMQEYLTGLRSVKEDFTRGRVAAVMNGSTVIGREQFELLFSHSVQSQMVTASGVRLALYETRREKLSKSRPRVPPGLSLMAPKAPSTTGNSLTGGQAS